MTDPRIEIAARAIQAAADDHEEFCSASLVQAAARAVLTALDAARPEGEGGAVDRALDAYINWSEWKTWAADDVEKCRANMRRALTAARATVAPDDNVLPMDLLPEGVGFSSLIALKEGYGVDLYSLSRKVASQVFSGTGPTPRVAMLAAIKATGDA